MDSLADRDNLSPMQRRLELDIARGLMIVWMTYSHLPTATRSWLNYPFGFVSSAEGFVFLSALLVGLIYTKLMGKEGLKAAQDKLLRRVGKLYLYHLGLILLLFFGIAPLLDPETRGALAGVAYRYGEVGPFQATFEAALLLHQPPLLDILPIYIFFMLATVPILKVIHAGKFRAILGLSFMLWLGAQFGLKAWFADLERSALPSFYPDMRHRGAFDPFGWQFLWFLGLAIGIGWAKGLLPSRERIERWALPTIPIILCLALARHLPDPPLELSDTRVYFDKWSLGVVRVLNFFLLFPLALRAGRFLDEAELGARFDRLKESIAKLGRSSLETYTAHLPLTFIALYAVGEDGGKLAPLPSLIALVSSYLVLYAVALIDEKRKAPPPITPPKAQPAG